jgi:hypothetical protein
LLESAGLSGESVIKADVEKWLEDRIFGELSIHYTKEEKISMLRFLAEIKGWIHTGCRCK